MTHKLTYDSRSPLSLCSSSKKTKIDKQPLSLSRKDLLWGRPIQLLNDQETTIDDEIVRYKQICDIEGNGISRIGTTINTTTRGKLILPECARSSHVMVADHTLRRGRDYYAPPQSVPVTVPSMMRPIPKLTAKNEEDGTSEKEKASNSMFCDTVMLPITYQPHPYSVVVGKGREAKDNVGNKRLRVLASLHLTKYAKAANDKTEKSRIVSSLVATIHEVCPLGAFIRLGTNGRWYNVSGSVAREKVGYTFRELLGDKYKSSSYRKAALRSQQQHPMKRKIELIGPPAA